MTDRFTARQTALLAVFTLSGFTGLIYESIWSHYLKIFLGHAAYAQTLVLAIFMGGMAIGAWLVGRRSARVRRLLLAYAVAELLIGLLGLAFHPVFEGFLNWSFATAIPSLPSPGAIQVYKWAAGACLILPQSVLLGMTFPMISGGLIRLARHRSGELLALLYFTNCLGAAFGVLASGFYLIGRVGLPGTLMTAGLLNILLALCVWALAKEGAEPAPQVAQESQPVPSRRRAWLVAAAFLTGVAAFLYELAWIRMLSLALGSSTHSFELMLAAFIFGLAFGGLWIRRRIDRLEDPLRFLTRVLLAMGILASLTVPGYHYTFDVVAWAKAAFAPTEAGYAGFNLVAQSLAMALMMPVTFYAGMTLPLITRLLMAQGVGERAIGGVYAVNTLGAIVGVMAATHLLMPAVGTKGTILAGAVLHLLLAATGAGVAPARPPARRAWLAFAVAVVVLLAVALGAHLDPRRMTSAVYRTGHAEVATGSEVVYMRDGKTATISLVRTGGLVTIATNGKPDAAIEMGDGPPAPDEITMIMAGALSLALHPSPRTVANIGIGSGLTSHVLLTSHEVETLTSIEIERFMIEAARMAYLPRVANLFQDRRSRIVVEDAKTYFAGARSVFDVIVSEPSNPWVSGVATLFSEEFYRHVIRYLAPDGILVQWLQIYETDLAVVSSILKALSPHFADYHVYNVDDSNILVVARRGRALPDPDSRVFAAGPLARELARGGILGPEDMTSRRIGNKRLLDPYVHSVGVPANSDYFPFVDQHAARFRFMNRNAIELPALTMLTVPFVELALPEWRVTPPERAPEFGQGRRETLVSRAGLIATGIASDHLGLLPGEVVRSVAALDTPAEECARPGYRDAWLASVRDLSDRTTAFLPYAELAPLWERITSSACYRDAVGDQALWPDFLHAVARRDRVEIATLGPRLLARSVADARPGDDGHVLTATAAALYGLGRLEDAATLVARWGASAISSGDYAMALRVLFAASQAGIPDRT